jgi:hypothetical protein
VALHPPPLSLNAYPGSSKGTLGGAPNGIDALRHRVELHPVSHGVVNREVDPDANRDGRDGRGDDVDVVVERRHEREPVAVLTTSTVSTTSAFGGLGLKTTVVAGAGVDSHREVVTEEKTTMFTSSFDNAVLTCPDERVIVNGELTVLAHLTVNATGRASASFRFLPEDVTAPTLKVCGVRLGTRSRQCHTASHVLGVSERRCY